MNKLAIFGGPKSINLYFKKYNPIGREELAAASSVIESGVLSQYLGTWHEDFFGGPKVREFEAAICDFFDVKYAVTVNSWTSGLVAAVAAIDIQPGDEVIVTPWTMSASAAAILHCNAIPVFSDIDRQTYNICPNSIEKNISPQTKAIIVADIFGLSADMDAIMTIARNNGLKVISDAAQAPGARYKGKWAGTLADVGGFSLNYHKHIHTGEGGILVTNDDWIAERLRLIRNHAEVVVEEMGVTYLSNMVGHNFRLGEIECAIGIEQLKKLPSLIKSRQFIAESLLSGIRDLEGLTGPSIPTGSEHVYYVLPFQVDVKKLGVSRDRICDALVAEGLPVMKRYQNIHLTPLYQNKIAFGRDGFPWSSDFCKREVNYGKGICPTAETLQDENFFGIGMCVYDLNQNDINTIIETFKKVWSNMEELQ